MPCGKLLEYIAKICFISYQHGTPNEVWKLIFNLKTKIIYWEITQGEMDTKTRVIVVTTDPVRLFNVVVEDCQVVHYLSQVNFPIFLLVKSLEHFLNLSVLRRLRSVKHLILRVVGMKNSVTSAHP